MTSKYTRILLAMAFVVSVAALAQTGSAAAAPAGAAPAVTSTGTKVGTISMEQAIFATNEGRRDFEALSKKLEPKQNELKGQNDEIDALKKQLTAQEGKLNDDARANLVKQIETKQKSLDRQLQDAREDAQNQQNEIAQRILQKMGPMLVKYAADNGYGVIIDTSNQWPNGPVLWAGPAVDITRSVVDLYNAQSGVAAPAPRPAATRPTTPASKPASTTPAAPKPQGTAAPK